jgi:hypothetical protein
MPSASIAIIPFIDGCMRDVFFDADGRQFVLDDNGEPMYGVWIYIDEPEIVAAAVVRQRQV